MPEGTPEFRHDRTMSLFRRAYACANEGEWEELAPKLGITNPESIRILWRTALKARASGMSAKQAFPLQADIRGMAEAMAGAYLSEVEVTPGWHSFSNKETNQWHMANHPLNTPPGKACRKCGSPRVMLPAYNTDYFDCLDCGHSWPQTEKQAAFMRRNPASKFSTESQIGETVFTNERVLNSVLTNAGGIIGRRDISALDKFETLFAYLLKARREVLGEVDV